MDVERQRRRNLHPLPAKRMMLSANSLQLFKFIHQITQRLAAMADRILVSSSSSAPVFSNSGTRKYGS